MSATTNPTTTVNKFFVSVGSTTGSCLPTGAVRCLQVVVTTAGEVRMCDPAQTGSTDPTSC
jgi:type IV fimbrial biogenesis protein FimT